MIAEDIVEFLESLGAKYVFGVPGSTTVSIINSISESKKLKFISGIHENASLSMADGYSRASGEIGIVVLHTTPGLATALPNLYNSFVDSVPLLVIVGDVDSRSLIREPGLSLSELENLAKPVSRWCYYAKSTSDIVTAFERSVSVLYSTQPGPCCIVVPEDLFEQNNTRALRKPASPPFRTTITPDSNTLLDVTTLIDKAKWPVVIVGREVRDPRSIQSLVEFCERLSVPVLLESPYPSAYGIGFPQDNICYLGLFRRESEVMKDADLVIGVGGQLFTERKFYETEALDPKVKVVHIHTNPRELGKNIKTDLPIMGTSDSAIVLFNEASKSLDSSWDERRRERKAKIEEIHARRSEERNKLASKPGDGTGVKPWKLIGAMYKVLSEKQNFVIVDEGVIASSYLSELFVFSKPGSLIGRSAGCLGWGVGAAIGAKLALPGQKVIAFVGDGALLFCPQGLWSAAHYGIPITVIVANNSGYTSVSLSYDSFGKRSKRKVSYAGTVLSEPVLDIVKLAESLGVRATSVQDETELVPALRKAVDSGKVELVDVHTDPKERGYEVSVGQGSAWT